MNYSPLSALLNNHINMIGEMEQSLDSPMDKYMDGKYPTLLSRK